MQERKKERRERRKKDTHSEHTFALSMNNITFSERHCVYQFVYRNACNRVSCAFFSPFTYRASFNSRAAALKSFGKYSYFCVQLNELHTPGLWNGFSRIVVIVDSL